MDLGDFQRSLFDGLYTSRIPIALGATIGAGLVLVLAWRVGWFAAARRHPARAAGFLVVVLAVALPMGYYLASPLWIRTELIEPGPVAAVDPAASLTPVTTDASASSPTPTLPPAPTSTPFATRPLAAGEFHGTDDFHFGRGTASIIETAPGKYTLRLEKFSVRNGPDLFVYLSPDAADYTDGVLELGRLKATDGAFGYELPPGTEPSDFASAIVWCKQFSHLFAVAPFAIV